MDRVPFGRTGLQVSRLGIGSSEIGFELSAGDSRHTVSVLNRALDAGINFLDTAECYGVAEELIGATTSGRRGEFVLATKTGHSTGDDRPSWAYQTIVDSIERSLRRVRTDHVDILQLHSCGVDELHRRFGRLDADWRQMTQSGVL